MHFRITGLPAAEFADLAQLSAEDLDRRHIVTRVANGPGYPCRVSLTDAAVGDTVYLLNYQHHDVATPYRSSHAIYVRADEVRYDECDRVPEQLRRRLLSVRTFDATGMLLDADVVEGAQLEPLIERQFTNANAAYLHLHYARPGCYAARVDRA